MFDRNVYTRNRSLLTRMDPLPLRNRLGTNYRDQEKYNFFYTIFFSYKETCNIFKRWVEFNTHTLRSAYPPRRL